MALIAQQNAWPHLSPGDAAPPASGARPAAPIMVFDRDDRLKMGGVEARLFHFGNAHTDNDTVVLFPDLKVVALGSLFTTSDPPVPDFAGGGSLVGWGPVLDQVLQLDFDVVVPGEGPLATRADLLAYRARIATVVARAGALVRQGVAKERLLAELKTDNLGWQFTLDAAKVAQLHADLLQAQQ